MRPVLFTWRGVAVHSYPALLYLGLTFGVYAGYGAAASMELDPDRAAAGMLILIVPALVGSRLWFVARNWQAYRHEPRRIWYRGEGGATLVGGLLLALALSPAVLAALGLPFGAFWDAATFTLLVGMVFTRVGCLLNGCCAGRPSEGRLALRLPGQAGRWERRHPVQLLELATAVALLAGCFALSFAEPPPGAIFVFALAGYGCVRSIIDPLRETRGLRQELS
ncbi:MAG TPA: prolipoprotein diacylglyceryl transferase family protein [Solirubrobacteraceae bacterium]|jgi:prolipoprotein diacylglyceryltransferase